MKESPGEHSHNTQIPQPVDPSARGVRQGEHVNYAAQWPLWQQEKATGFSPLVPYWKPGNS